jgi:hypothetical protein
MNTDNKQQKDTRTVVDSLGVAKNVATDENPQKPSNVEGVYNTSEYVDLRIPSSFFFGL